METKSVSINIFPFKFEAQKSEGPGDIPTLNISDDFLPNDCQKQI